MIDSDDTVPRKVMVKRIEEKNEEILRLKKSRTILREALERLLEDHPGYGIFNALKKDSQLFYSARSTCHGFYDEYMRSKKARLEYENEMQVKILTDEEVKLKQKGETK